ncbi:unnamed protein product, partial [Iphiclides podalirius]
MESRGLFLSLLLVGVCASIAAGSVIDIRQADHAETYNSIPKRCAEKTMTKVQCIGLSDDRMMAHPDDCQLFYYCVGDRSICRECPAGLHFNPVKHVCDFPSVAGCRLPSG